MHADSDKPLLTFAHLREWQATAAALEQTIEMSQVELAALRRRIDAALALVETLPATEREAAVSQELPSPDAPPLSSDEKEGEAVSPAVLAAVTALKGAPRPRVIRQWIAKNNPQIDAKLRDHPQYFYTVLARHVQGGRLAKRGNGYRLPLSSRKGNPGGSRPPESFTHGNGETKGDAEDGPKAGGT
jgi:hypothetical protein